MGLDITAYSNLIHVGKHEKDVAKNEGEPGGLDDWCYYTGEQVAALLAEREREAIRRVVDHFARSIP